MLIKSSEALDEKRCSSAKHYWLFKLLTAMKVSPFLLAWSLPHPTRSWEGGHRDQLSSGAKSELDLGLLPEITCRAPVATKILNKGMKF